MMKFPGPGSLIKLIIPAIVIYALLMIYDSGEKRAEAERVLCELGEQAQKLRRENERLQMEIDSSRDDAVIADVARERFALVMPGEIVFYDPSE